MTRCSSTNARSAAANPTEDRHPPQRRARTPRSIPRPPSTAHPETSSRPIPYWVRARQRSLQKRAGWPGTSANGRRQPLQRPRLGCSARLARRTELARHASPHHFRVDLTADGIGAEQPWQTIAAAVDTEPPGVSLGACYHLGKTWSKPGQRGPSGVLRILQLALRWGRPGLTGAPASGSAGRSVARYS
jgi:hypothetical protein